MFKWVNIKKLLKSEKPKRKTTFTEMFPLLVMHIGVDRMNEELKDRGYSLVKIVNVDYHLIFEGKSLLAYRQAIAKPAHLIDTNCNFVTENEADQIGLKIVDILMEKFSEELVKRILEEKEQKLKKQEKKSKAAKDFKKRIYEGLE